MIDPKDCPSTHGGAGYAIGTHWDGDALVCGLCATRIERPRPTGFRAASYTFRDVRADWRCIWPWLTGQEKPRIPTYPEWIR